MHQIDRLLVSRYSMAMIRQRLIFYIPGFDSIDPPVHYRRFVRQLETFECTWELSSKVQESQISAPCATWTTTTHGSHWQVTSIHNLLAWDDIVRAEAARHMPTRLWKTILVYLDLLLTGTLFRYGRANPRYLIFCIFPLVQLAVLGFGAWIAARLFSGFLDLQGTAASIAVWLFTAIAFLCLLAYFGRRWRVNQLLDDWIFASDYIYGRRSDIDARLDSFVDIIIAKAREIAADEIVIVGHSLGAVLSIDVALRTLSRSPDLAHRKPICVLTVGATIPKFTLHPHAEWIRCMIAQAVADPSIFWAEYQARDDAISFYKFNPASMKRIGNDRAEGKPVIRRVQIHDMLQPNIFARYRFRFLRLHYQWVMANGRLAPYDYFMAMCGPVPFATWTTAQNGLLDYVGVRGELQHAF